jgi:hypothetical protein
MPKRLYSSAECPDNLADWIGAHRFGVVVTSSLALFAALWIGNGVDVHHEQLAIAKAEEARAAIRLAEASAPERDARGAPRGGDADNRFEGRRNLHSENVRSSRSGEVETASVR